MGLVSLFYTIRPKGKTIDANKMRKPSILIGLFSLLFLCSGCVHRSASDRVEEKLANEASADSKAEMIDKSHSIIMNHPSLSAAERKEMDRIFSSVKEKTSKIRAQTAKLKYVFFKTLMAEEQNQGELDIITKKLVHLNQEKMNLMFEALGEVKKVLSPKTRSLLYQELPSEVPFFYK